MIGIPLKRTMSRTLQEAPIAVIPYIQLKMVRPHATIDIVVLSVPFRNLHQFQAYLRLKPLTMIKK